MQTVLNPFMQEAAETLIGNLLASQAFVRYQRAQTRLNEDSNARSLLEQFSKAQANLRRMQASGSVTQSEIEALHAIQEQVQSNHMIMDYAQAQQEAVNFLREINAEISQLLGIDFASFTNRATC